MTEYISINNTLLIIHYADGHPLFTLYH